MDLPTRLFDLLTVFMYLAAVISWATGFILGGVILIQYFVSRWGLRGALAAIVILIAVTTSITVALINDREKEHCFVEVVE